MTIQSHQIMKQKTQANQKPLEFPTVVISRFVIIADNSPITMSFEPNLRLRNLRSELYLSTKGQNCYRVHHQTAYPTQKENPHQPKHQAQQTRATEPSAQNYHTRKNQPLETNPKQTPTKQTINETLYIILITPYHKKMIPT
jgi:hypothetical protein